MSTKTELLKYLDDNFGVYVSGEKLAKELGISRAAVNKAAKALNKSGFKVYSRPSQGYCIREKKDVLSEASLEGLIPYPCKIRVFDTIESTNTYAKTLSLDDVPTVIIANSQSAGRGRLGRSFESPANTGLYMSFAFKPQFDLSNSPFVTLATAVAVCRAIEEVCDVNAKIKWINDIFYREKKVAGILTEAQTNLETGRIDSLIIGIGINCFPGNFSDDIKDIAGPLSDEFNSFSRTKLAASIVNKLFEIMQTVSEKSFLSEYRRRCFILGKGILVKTPYTDHPIKARAIDIDQNGGLVVEYMEGVRMREMETLMSGEITVRPDTY